LQTEFAIPVTFRRLMQDLCTMGAIVKEVMSQAKKELSDDDTNTNSGTPECTSSSDKVEKLPSAEHLLKIIKEQNEKILELQRSLQDIKNSAEKANVNQTQSLSENLEKKRSIIMDCSNPPSPGARLGRDRNGNPTWFEPDPANPGKFRKVDIS